MRVSLDICLALLLLPGAAAADPGQLELAGRAVAARIAADPAGTEELFEKEFFTRISLENLNRTVLGGLYREHGAVTETVLASSDARSGHFFMDTERGWRIPAAISLNPESGKITGLFFGAPYRKNAALAGIKKAVAGLPGRAGMLAARLGPGGEYLEALAADEHFAAGDAFRLYLLGAAVRSKLPWEAVHRLSREDRSPAPGGLRNWPAGSPVTVHTLAAEMIARNDGTAADALVSELGRRKVEASLAPLGHSRPELMTPFLKTSELFRLKSGAGTALEYLNLPQEEKYSFLDSLAATPPDTAAPGANPLGMARVGRFASPAGLCRLMAFIYGSGNRGALDILAINPGPVPAGAGFAYAGYIGGREQGALSMTWLLVTRGSEKLCLSAAWNDESHNLDEKKFYGLMRSALDALAGAGRAGGPASGP